MMRSSSSGGGGYSSSCSRKLDDKTSLKNRQGGCSDSKGSSSNSERLRRDSGGGCCGEASAGRVTTAPTDATTTTTTTTTVRAVRRGGSSRAGGPQCQGCNVTEPSGFIYTHNNESGGGGSSGSSSRGGAAKKRDVTSASRSSNNSSRSSNSSSGGGRSSSKNEDYPGWRMRAGRATHNNINNNSSSSSNSSSAASGKGDMPQIITTATTTTSVMAGNNNNNNDRQQMTSTSGKKLGRPSARLNPKTIDPFNTSTKKQSAFSAVYINGGIPCWLVHGSVKHKLAWKTSPEKVPFDPVLVTLAEGLRETVHPYEFVARQGFKELLEVPGSAERCIAVLPKLVQSLRAALTHTNDRVFEGGISALSQLSAVTKDSLNPFLKTLLLALAKRRMEKKYREKVTELLEELEQNGGAEALVIIKSKVPTYGSIHR